CRRQFFWDHRFGRNGRSGHGIQDDSRRYPDDRLVLQRDQRDKAKWPNSGKRWDFLWDDARGWKRFRRELEFWRWDRFQYVFKRRSHNSSRFQRHERGGTQWRDSGSRWEFVRHDGMGW